VEILEAANDDFGGAGRCRAPISGEGRRSGRNSSISAIVQVFGGGDPANCIYAFNDLIKQQPSTV